MIGVMHTPHTVKLTASTELTFFWKFVFPVLFGIPFFIGALALLRQHLWLEALPFAVTTLLIVANCIWLCPRFMKVKFDEEFLYACNGG